MLLAWVHDLSPFLIRFTPTFGIRWYGLSYAAAFVISWFVLKALSRKGLFLVPERHVSDAMTALVIGVVAGGRLGYVFFYDPQLFLTFEKSFPWWGVLAINKGGMASHGGFIGVIVASWYISRGFKKRDENKLGIAGSERVGRSPQLHILDVLAAVAPIGLMLGRIANFVNGELLGAVVSKPGEPSPWWAVKFPQEIGSGHAPELTPEQSNQLLDLLERHGGEAGLLDAVQHGYGAEHGMLIESLAPLLAARHPSQLYQAIAEGPVLFVVLWLIWRRPRVPGVVGCWFLITYGVLRIMTELWRLPDAQHAIQRFAGLSRGQWLSVGMIVVGAVTMTVVLSRAKRMQTEKLGGWAHSAATAKTATSRT